MLDKKKALCYNIITVREEQKQPAGVSSEAQAIAEGGKLRAAKPRSGVQFLRLRKKFFISSVSRGFKSHPLGRRVG